MEMVAQESRETDAWAHADTVFKACACLATQDASLLTKDIVDALAGCAARCPPDNVRYENVHDTMGRIQDTFDTFDTLYENR